MPMVGGPICAVTPPNASNVKGIRTPNKRVIILFFVVLLFNQGERGKFIIIKLMFWVV